MSAPGKTRLEPGFRLDRYELLCPIAHGGMASVWLARLSGKHGFEKLVAIKTILPDRAEDPHFRRMFLDEARIASGIDHANVAHILDLGEDEDLLYLVMEWIDGDSLSKLLRAAERRGHRVPLGVTMRVIADAASGLHAAHELKDTSGRSLSVVHRDVSPQNILVSAQGNAKLIDFGIAKAVDRLTQTIASAGPSLKGKIGYMAPEQAMGHELDRRTDIWALGAVLYFMLSGKAPFEGMNDVATLYELTRGKPPPALGAHIPEPLRNLTFELLSHERSARPETAAEVQRKLEEMMADLRSLTTTADVARYVEEQLAERADARRKAVGIALDAASQRAKGGAKGGATGPLGEKSDVLTVHAPLQMPELSPGGIDARHVTSATLGGSASVLDAKTGTTVMDVATKRLWAMVAGVSGALGLVAVLLVVLLVTRHHEAPAAPAVSTPDPIPAPPPPPIVTGVIGASNPPLPETMHDAGSSEVPAVTAAAPPATAKATAKPTATKPPHTDVGATHKKSGAVDDGF